MRYVAANTTIPVPKIYHWGTAEENPLGLGPFMIMEYIEHDKTLSHALNARTLGPTDSHSLDPNMWWIPTGPLVRFSLHAARYHTSPGFRTALDRVFSSDNSPIKTILHTRQQHYKPIAAESCALAGSHRRALSLAWAMVRGGKIIILD